MRNCVLSIIVSIIYLCGYSLSISAQTGDIRGFVYEEETSEPIVFTSVQLEGTSFGSTTDNNGFYSINRIPLGTYTLKCSYMGYEEYTATVEVKEQILNHKIILKKASINLDIVEIVAEKEEKKTEIQASAIKLTAKQINQLPSIGGTPDLAQYLQILPGITSTGDQGGQLYIRGGAPIQTRILMDGLTIYNPYHSIGFFSVFDTDLIRNVDVITGGFNASYGGRISAVVDVTMKDGNKKEMQGKITGSPFLAKLNLEGPIKKEKPGHSSIAYLFSVKKSFLDRTSKSLYEYVDEKGLPYNFTDFFGKINFSSYGGSKGSIFGYSNSDNVNFDLADFNWVSYGGGANFVVVPNQAKVILGGNMAYSTYDTELTVDGGKPSKSSIGGFNIGLNFSYFLKNGSIKYGFDVGGYNTSLSFFNALNLNIEEFQNSTEIGFYFVDKLELGRLILEPSVRADYYSSLSAVQLQPRLGIKYNLTENLRVKLAGGKYAQNFLSTKSDRDVVNLFNGYLSAPEGSIEDYDGNEAKTNLQIAWHGVAGLEMDINKNLTANIEGYYKDFTQILDFNRNKLFPSDPTFIVEDGDAYGMDFWCKYQGKNIYIWGAYSLGYVTRNNGEQVYAPHYDRRHNLNALVTYVFGKKKSWEASVRWNLGTGFPFTKTQGFYEQLDFGNGIQTNINNQNGQLGILYEQDLDNGRLPSYHRLDMGLTKKFQFTRKISAELNLSVTNAYDRENIFYFDRISYKRVNQLPVLPSLSFSVNF